MGRRSLGTSYSRVVIGVERRSRRKFRIRRRI
jgi:hypothetical protein